MFSYFRDLYFLPKMIAWMWAITNTSSITMYFFQDKDLFAGILTVGYFWDPDVIMLSKYILISPCFNEKLSKHFWDLKKCLGTSPEFPLPAHLSNGNYASLLKKVRCCTHSKTSYSCVRKARKAERSNVNWSVCSKCPGKTFLLFGSSYLLQQ